MAATVEKYALLHFKHRHAFESTDLDICDILPLINRAWKNPLQQGKRTRKQSLAEDDYTCTGDY